MTSLEAGLLISAIQKYRRYYRRYFLSIGIADTFVAMYRFEYQRYFLTLSNVDTFTDTFSFEFWFSSSLSMESVTQWGLQCTNCTVLVKP
jgi:hypothetical protein